jgi:protein TonB
MTLSVAKSNAEFKGKYRKYVRNAVWMAALIHIVLFAVFPAVSFKPYQLKEEKLELVDLPPEFEVPPAPREIAMPQVNVVPAEDGEAAPDNLDLPATTFDAFSSMPPPPPPSTGGDAQGEFLAFDEPPVLIDNVAPEYPDFAREAGLEGTVQVKVLVDEQGNVIEAQVVSSDVWPSMERAAVEAAKKCRFKPAFQRTTPVKAHVVIPFEFLLN